jgi:hypothetical protein
MTSDSGGRGQLLRQTDKGSLDERGMYNFILFYFGQKIWKLFSEMQAGNCDIGPCFPEGSVCDPSERVLSLRLFLNC